MTTTDPDAAHPRPTGPNELLPLSARVDAPTVLDVPTPVGGLTFRPVVASDVPMMWAVAVDAAAVDDPRSRPAQEQLEQELSTPGLDLATHAIVGVDADGHVQAHAFVLPVSGRETMVRVILVGAVRPALRGRGIGRALLAWQLDRGRQVLAASDLAVPGMLETTPAVDTAHERLAARLGLAPQRTWFEVERALDQPVAERVLPVGLTLRAMGDGDLERVRVARNDAFRDHWGSQPSSAEVWNAHFGGSTFRPDLARVVVDADDRVVAFTMVSVDPASFAARGAAYGYVDYVGVVRDHRGRGLAPTVLGAALIAMRDAALETAVLHVDAESPTGALGMYEGLGFVRSGTTVSRALLF